MGDNQPMTKFDWQHRKILLIAGAVVLALVCVLVFVLLKGGGEKQLGQRIERLYSLEDPRFVHELGVLLEIGRASCRERV